MSHDSTTCDLHLHSSASRKTEEWYSRYFACPESFIPPEEQYDLCKARGMSLVTLTDHDTIEGGLLLLDRPDFFLSEEVTVRFAHNGCVIHVLVWNINPDQHAAIQERRNDAFRLVDYLHGQGLSFAWAHPLFSPNGGLDAETCEQALLLFPTLETVNGLLDRRIGNDLTDLLSSVDDDVWQRLVAKHAPALKGHVCPQRPGWSSCAGSDDHVRRRAGSVYTSVPRAGLSPSAFLAAVKEGRGQPVGVQADLATMATCVANTTFRFLDQNAIGRDGGDPFVDLVRVVAGQLGVPGGGVGHPFLGSLSRWATQARARVRRLDELPAPEVCGAELDADDKGTLDSFARVLDEACSSILPSLVSSALSFDLYGLLDGVRDLVCAALASSPFLFSAAHFGKQHAQVRGLRQQWTASSLPSRRKRLALFSDSLEQVDGVSTWCHRFVGQARQNGCDVIVPTCQDDLAALDPKVFRRLPSVASFPLPLYASMRLFVPSPLRTIDALWRADVSNVELSTPGPMGLLGLLSARLLQLPVTATYHTEIPGLVPLLQGGAVLDGALKRYLRWFYEQAAAVFVYSARARTSLVDMGVTPSRIVLLPMTVDPHEFSPHLGHPSVFHELGVDPGDRPVVLSVGRLSAEKNVATIIEAVLRLQDGPRPPLLIVVGDGPARADWQATYGNETCVRFVGERRGEVLRRLYASARAFAFASRIDTLGLVNLEAMASGTPVLLPAEAGLSALAEHGRSAHFYSFGVEGLAVALRQVLDDNAYAQRLGTHARAAMVARWESFPFARLWDSLTLSA